MTPPSPSSKPSDASQPLSPAEELYAQYLTRRQQGATLDIDAWCASHPDHAADLRKLDAQYGQLSSIFERLMGSQPAPEKRLADELRERYGEGVDPGISLDGGGASQSDSGPSSELLRRLRTHAPKNSRYKLQGEIGRGGMGAVIRVWDEDLRRTLAMKVVLGKEEHASKGATPPVDSRTLGRFLEEAQITGQLDHPGIVPVHELGLGADGQVYFTMRLVKGEDLRTIFQHVESGHEGWSTTRALTVMLKVCEAMAYAHAKGVIHRDLKPANIMVGKYGEVYVMDWGLARVAGTKDLHDLRLKSADRESQSVRTTRREERDETPGSPIVTMDGDVMGTPAYMPPEQARGDITQLGPHSDVYAVGAMLYHLLLVKHIEMPYVAKGARATARTVLLRVLEEAPKAIHSLEKTAPAPLVAIVEKAMAREIGGRYRDMEALASDLRAYVEGRVVQAYETGTWAETKQWVRRNKPLAASIAAGALVLVAGAGLVLRESARADEERDRTADANRQLSERNSVLQVQAREQQLLGMIQELARFRAQCRTLEGLDRLGTPAYRWWLDESAKLLDGQAEDLATGVEWRPGRKDVQAKLAELRGAALDSTEADRARDEATHPVQALIRSLESQLAEELAPIDERLSKAQKASAGVDAGLVAEQAAVRARYESQLAPLRSESKERRTWRFADSQQEWWHAQLAALDGELTWLAKMREAALSSTETEHAKARWSEAIEGIARSPKYAGQHWPSGDRLAPQAGLLPLGVNPATGLWEFVHLQSGVEPQTGLDGRALRDGEGRLMLTPATGMVMILLPGGRVPKESSDQGQQSWIPSVELGPFFISKYEITHEQWDRLSTRRGVAHRSEVPLVAVNQVSWDDARAMWLRELGWCGLPSEAQWEYACRAGTHTRWWIGDDLQALVGVANVVLGEMDENCIAPVGSLKPNPFGLHDVHGNVSEWCGDGYVAVMPARPLDGLRDDGADRTRFRVVRGGDWRLGPVHASSAGRYGESPGNRFDHGLRASRGITP